MPQGSHLCCVGKPRRTQTKHPDDVKDCLLLFHRNPLTRVPPHVLWVVGIVSRTTSSCSQSVAQFHFPAIKTNYSCCGFLLLLTHVLLELWVVLRVSSICLRLNVSYQAYACRFMDESIPKKMQHGIVGVFKNLYSRTQFDPV